MKIADLEIKEQEFGETTKEPGLVCKKLISKTFLTFERLSL